MIKLLIFISLFSCSIQKNKFREGGPSSAIKSEKAYFSYEAINQSLTLERVRLIRNKKLNLRYTVFDEKKNIQDQVYSVSDLGVIQVGTKKIPLARPAISQSTLNIDGREYFSQIKLNTKKRGLEIVYRDGMSSEGDQAEFISLKSSDLYCFFTQIPECFKRVRFIKESTQGKIRSMGMKIIWESYPFNSMRFDQFNKTVVSSAQMNYDGFQDGVHKFILESNAQTIFYHFDSNLNFIKMFWVAQGMSIELK